MALSKHVTHYRPRSGFPYYDLTIFEREGLLYPPPGDALGCSVGRALGTLPVWSQQREREEKLAKCFCQRGCQSRLCGCLRRKTQCTELSVAIHSGIKTCMLHKKNPRKLQFYIHTYFNDPPTKVVGHFYPFYLSLLCLFFCSTSGLA